MDLKLKSGEAVSDRKTSHLKQGVAALLPEALSQIESRGRQFFREEINFGRIIGETTRVATGGDDEIVYAMRPNRFGPSRFVKNRRPEPCSTMVVILKKAEETDDLYILITAFIGTFPEPEPWDRHATPASKVFWSRNALVWGTEEVIPGTETTEYPCFS